MRHIAFQPDMGAVIMLLFQPHVIPEHPAEGFPLSRALSGRPAGRIVFPEAMNIYFRQIKDDLAPRAETEDKCFFTGGRLHRVPPATLAVSALPDTWLASSPAECHHRCPRTLPGKNSGDEHIHPDGIQIACPLAGDIFPGEKSGTKEQALQGRKDLGNRNA